MERAPRPRPAGGPDLPAVRLDDRPGDVEPEPEAASVRVLELGERLEHAIQVAFGDSGPLVLDGNLEVVPRPRRQDGDPALDRAELYGVGKKVRKHLEHPVAIGRRPQRGVGNGETQRERLDAGEGPKISTASRTRAAASRGRGTISSPLELSLTEWSKRVISWSMRPMVIRTFRALSAAVAPSSAGGAPH